MPRIIVLHNAVAVDAAPHDQDVLVQVHAVCKALRTLGHEPQALSCTLNLELLREQLDQARPDVVFNLVESLGGLDRLIHVVPAFLESLGVRYTGVPADALFVTASKLRTKTRLRELGLPTPPWLAAEGTSSAEPITGPYIVKTIDEHASFGLDDSAVHLDSSTIPPAEAIAAAAQRHRRPCFAEQFIDGREFNLSLLAAMADATGGDVLLVLPPAEIDFVDFPPGKPRIVGYKAKWDEAAAEFHRTPRRFNFPDADRGLLRQLAYLARECWLGFGLRGYARVDFRVDQAGNPWILEINANPCLSPDAGFAAALQQAGISFPEAVRRLLEEVLVTARDAQPLCPHSDSINKE